MRGEEATSELLCQYLTRRLEEVGGREIGEGGREGARERVRERERESERVRLRERERCVHVEGCQSAMRQVHAAYKEPNRPAARKGH